MTPPLAMLILQAAHDFSSSGAAQYVGEALVVLIVAGKGLLDHRGGRRRDKSLGEQFGELSAGIAEVRAFCVGPDGKNGIRGDVHEIKKRVIGLEDRERDRLERAAAPPRDFSLPSAPSRSPAQ